ncbi:MAG: hypothetical protein ACREI2_05865 [Nitrospiraceae bacterium]
MPPLDLTCPSCGTERTQRLNLLRRFYGDGGFVGHAFLSEGLERPHQPWGFTAGFLVGLLLGAISYVILPEAYQLFSVLPLVLGWLGVGVRARMKYHDKRAKWESALDQYFMCLRCGDVFRPRKQRPDVP